MGSLDDAIREHLELKRQHGASEEEVKRQEEEAFGRGRRMSPEEAAPEDATAGALSPDDVGVADELEAVEPESNGQPAALAEPPSDEDRPARAFEPEPVDPDEVPSEESLEPDLDRREEPEASSEPVTGEPPGRVPGDPLEKTPEFLEESEEDRLWFEQSPPKDFDLD